MIESQVSYDIKVSRKVSFFSSCFAALQHRRLVEYQLSKVDKYVFKIHKALSLLMTRGI